MLKSIRRSFGLSPSASDLQEYLKNGNADGVLSPSNKPNTFVPLRRSNSFTNFFSSSRPSSPNKETAEQSSSSAIASPAKASTSAINAPTESDAVLAYLVLIDKKGRQKERFPIQNESTTMGRSLDNDVRFLVNEVSRHHCTIEIQIGQDRQENNTQAVLRVLGANGVLLNGKEAFPAPRGAGRYQLQSGDSIVLAKRSFIFELPQLSSSEVLLASPKAYSSPIKGGTQSSVPQTPSNRRRIRMSLVNAAQINTPARPSKKGDSPSKTATATAERDARRANGLQRFMQSANVSPGKSGKGKSRQSLTSSMSAADVFGTPVKSRSALEIPSTAPPKQVSFSLYSNSFTGRLSPVKQMRMMPPLDTMDEEQDGSFHSEKDQPMEENEEMAEQEGSTEFQQDDSADDLVIVEELEHEQAMQSEPETAIDSVAAVDAEASEDIENVAPATPSTSSRSSGSPSKSGSPKRAKRRSSFFGRAGPFAGINLGFYPEERAESKEPAQEIQQADEPAEEFLDASDAEQAPTENEQPSHRPVSSPVARRVVARSIGMSKTPSPVKHQHFAGLTPLARRPRLSLASRRKVSLRTQTLLRSSEAYSDRLFLPPPPPSPSSPSGLSKSMSMPSDLCDLTPVEPEPAFDYPEGTKHGAQPDSNDFDVQLGPALSEEEAEAAEWRDSEDDEDEVDQSLSAISPSPQPAYHFSPVRASTLPKFATPQPACKSHSRRISMPLVGETDAKPSIRSTLVRLQISGAGERIVHDVPRKDEAAPADVSRAERSSPSKARKVVRVSDVGLPATDLSMGFDLVQDHAAEQQSNTIAVALDDLFTAEQEELTDDEGDEETEEQEEIVQISSKVQESPARSRPLTFAPMKAPQTPAALNSVRHLFSAAAAAPATPDMQGVGSMLACSPSKAPKYGSLGDRMRGSPERSELLSPSKSPSKRAVLGSSPEKSRRSVRRSQAAEMAVTTVQADAPSSAAETVPVDVASSQRQPSMPEQTAYEAELHVTMFDASAMDAENEAIAQALNVAELQRTEAEEDSEAIVATPAIEEIILEEPAEEEASEGAEIAQTEADLIEEPVQEVVAVPANQAFEPPVAMEGHQAEDSDLKQPTSAQPSPFKARTSRRAASTSPVKRTARSASPTKATIRSSPVKRGAAPKVFAEEVVQETVQEGEAAVDEVEPVQDIEATVNEAQPEYVVTETESSSPTKATRRTGGRKAKQAAAEAISTLVAPAPAQSSPAKPAKRGRAAAKKADAEPTGEEHQSEREDTEAAGEDEEVEEAPKRSTRTRATRAKPAATKATRSTRTRTVKAAEPALPSSSTGYGDDEASEEDVPAAPVKTRRAATSRAKTAKATKATAAVGDEEADLSVDEPEATRTKPSARATRTRTTTTAQSRTKASVPDSEDASSATTGTTTRSGRTTRRTAK